MMQRATRRHALGRSQPQPLIPAVVADILIRQRPVLRVVHGAVVDGWDVALRAPLAGDPAGEVHEQRDEVAFGHVGDLVRVEVLRTELDDGVAEDEAAAGDVV